MKIKLMKDNINCAKCHKCVSCGLCTCNPTLADARQKEDLPVARNNSKPQVGEKLIMTTEDVLKVVFSDEFIQKKQVRDAAKEYLWDDERRKLFLKSLNLGEDAKCQ